eukprot:scaffold14371_cov115-Isochrysis_galbana.AAC.5
MARGMPPTCTRVWTAPTSYSPATTSASACFTLGRSRRPCVGVVSGPQPAASLSAVGAVAP